MRGTLRKLFTKIEEKYAANGIRIREIRLGVMVSSM